jgi:hypothetical protein
MSGDGHSRPEDGIQTHFTLGDSTDRYPRTEGGGTTAYCDTGKAAQCFVPPHGSGTATGQAGPHRFARHLPNRNTERDNFLTNHNELGISFFLNKNSNCGRS